MTTPRERSRVPITGVQIRIGVVSGRTGQPGGGKALPAVWWPTIAERGICLLTGACPGLTHASVLGANEVRHAAGASEDVRVALS